MKANQARYPVRTMCRVLKVSTSGFYAWCVRPLSNRYLSDLALKVKIRAIHDRSRGTYGRPRVHAELKADGHRVSGKRIARLMREEGLAGASRRRFTVTTRRRKDARPAPDLVTRNFKAQTPDELWVADITYVPTWAGFIYLAIVLDACSRGVVGWSMETLLRTELVLQALNMVLSQRRPNESTQYTSIAFGLRCREMNVQPSMGSVGDAYDNAMAESFFATLECELLDRRRFKSQAEGAWPSSSSSKAGTTRSIVTQRSDTCHPSTMRGGSMSKTRLQPQATNYPRKRVNSRDWQKLAFFKRKSEVSFEAKKTPPERGLERALPE